MKRGFCVALACLTLTLSGLRGWCAPRTRSAHDCCPRTPQAPVSSPAPLPDCCFVSALRAQIAVEQVKTGKEAIQAMAQARKGRAFGLEPKVISRPVDLRALSNPVSPLSPLLQTCLLLI